MSQTVSGYHSAPVTLSTTSVYASPTTIAGTINGGGNPAVYINSPWSLDVTGVLNSDFDGIFAPAAATITNSGSIHGRSFDGIFLSHGGSLYNQSSGTLIGGLQGLYSYYKYTAAVTNAGYILGSKALQLGGGGDVSNASDGIITGISIAVDLAKPGTLINAGDIFDIDSQGIGVSLAGGGIWNTGTIIAVTGISADGGTIVNAGLVEGETLDNNAGTYTPSASGTAIAFSNPGMFMEDATGIVLGSVAGDGGTLELGAGQFTLLGLGSEITGFASDIFAPAAQATLSGQLAGFGIVSGFTAKDMLQITDRTANAGTFSGDALTLTNGGIEIATIDFSGTYAGNAFKVTDTPQGTDVILNALACFAAGTKILTPSGDIKVEDLKPGDLVITRNHGDAPIVWVGKRRINLARHPNPASAQPICIRAGALGHNTPSVDLYLSPDHALFLENHLVPAKALVNHHNITILGRKTITYYHIELAEHGIIFAESTAVETYLETGGRAAFENAGKVLSLHADFAQKFRENESCADFLETGPIVDTIRAAIAARHYLLRNAV